MTMTSDRTLPGAIGPTTYPDDQLYLLKLCLELQVEALLLALGSSAVASRGRRVNQGRPAGAASTADLPWEKWLAQDLDLAHALTRDCVEDGIPLPSSMGLVGAEAATGVVESLAARYSAMATVVGEMLDRTDARTHGHAVARLSETRARCVERLDMLLGESPEAAAEHLFTPTEPGHYLG
jgi:hypothetical protein